jgi:predicted Zn-ribbon and HTH transcriptional regulator
VKNDGMPARCPHCSSPSWNKNRTVSRNKGMKCHCRHCGWTWTAVKPDEPPVMCPHCRRYEWNEKPTPKPTTK